MNFGQALDALRAGQSVTRSGWNGKNLKLTLQTPDANSKMTLPYIYLEYPPQRLGEGQSSPDRVPWLASQTDMLATDWGVVGVLTSVESGADIPGAVRWMHACPALNGRTVSLLIDRCRECGKFRPADGGAPGGETIL